MITPLQPRFTLALGTANWVTVSPSGSLDSVRKLTVKSSVVVGLAGAIATVGALGDRFGAVMPASSAVGGSTSSQAAKTNIVSRTVIRRNSIAGISPAFPTQRNTPTAMTSVQGISEV